MGTYKRTGRPLQPNEVLVKEFDYVNAKNDEQVCLHLEKRSIDGWQYVDSWPYAEIVEKVPGARRILLERVVVKTKREVEEEKLLSRREMLDEMAQEVKQAYEYDGTPVAKEYEGARVQRSGNKSVRDHGAQDRFPRLHDPQGG